MKLKIFVVVVFFVLLFICTTDISIGQEIEGIDVSGLVEYYNPGIESFPVEDALVSVEISVRSVNQMDCPFERELYTFTDKNGNYWLNLPSCVLVNSQYVTISSITEYGTIEKEMSVSELYFLDGNVDFLFRIYRMFLPFTMN